MAAPVCFSCSCEEKYKIYDTDHFKVVLDETCQLFPGKFLIISREHVHPDDIYGNFGLFREIQVIKIQMESAIRKAFGSGESYHRNIRFNYCKLGNSFKNPREEHFHEYGVPTSPTELVVDIDGFTYIFAYHHFGKPFDNTLRNITPSIVLEWITAHIRNNLDILGSITIPDEIKYSFLKTCSDTCYSCTPAFREKAPLFQTRYFKIVLNTANQWCFGRLHIVSRYHFDIDAIKFYQEIIEEYWALLQVITKLIYKFYDDEEKNTTRIHECKLNNLTGKIGDSHFHSHIIPRTTTPIKIGKYELSDIFWGNSFNNNIAYIPSDELLNLIRIRYLSILISVENMMTWVSNKYILSVIQNIEILDVFNPDISAIKMEPGCYQCDNSDKDDAATLLVTSNYRNHYKRG